MLRVARQCRVVRENRAAAAGGDSLVAIEAERRHATERSSMAAADRAAERLGGVFDHGEPEMTRQREHSVDVHGMSKRVHRNDGANHASRRAVDAESAAHLALALEVLTRRAWVESERALLAVDEVRHRAAMGHCRGRGDKAQRWN